MPWFKVLAGVFDPPPEGLTVPWVYLVLLFESAIGLTTAVLAAHLQDLQSKSVVGKPRSSVWVSAGATARFARARIVGKESYGIFK